MESVLISGQKTLAKVKICLCQINSSSLKNTIVVVTPQKNPKMSENEMRKKTICQLSKGSFSDDLHILNQDFAIAPSAIKLPHVCNWQDPHPTRVISIQFNLSFFLYNDKCVTNVWQKSFLCSISTLFLLDRWWLSQNTANAKSTPAHQKAVAVGHFSSSKWNVGNNNWW